MEEEWKTMPNEGDERKESYLSIRNDHLKWKAEKTTVGTGNDRLF